MSTTLGALSGLPRRNQAAKPHHDSADTAMRSPGLCAIQCRTVRVPVDPGDTAAMVRMRNQTPVPREPEISTTWEICHTDTTAAICNQITTGSSFGARLRVRMVSAVAMISGTSTMPPRIWARTCGINCVTRGAAM